MNRLAPLTGSRGAKTIEPRGRAVVISARGKARRIRSLLWAVAVVAGLLPLGAAAQLDEQRAGEPQKPAEQVRQIVAADARRSPRDPSAGADGMQGASAGTVAGRFGESVTKVAEAILPRDVRETLDAPVLGNLSRFRLAISACVLVALIALRFTLSHLFRRRLIDYDIEAPRTAQIVLKALHRPLLLVVWSYGLYAAAAPLLETVRDSEGNAYALQLAGTVTDAIGLLAFFWFIFRLVSLGFNRICDWAAASKNRFERILVPLVARYLRVVLPLVAVHLTLPILRISAEYSQLVRQLATLFIIGVVTWMLIQAIEAFGELIRSSYRLEETDNLEARRVHTQVQMLEKVAITSVLIVSGASMLMVFPAVRQFGASILASAGIVGIIVGIAAQRSLANLIAGFQIAITQPIRIEDAVVVEGEWGWIEEITLTYVVVRIWDWRRLVLPITYFVEKPFQNWTRTSGNILGSVFLYLDYTVPLDELRRKLDEILEDTDLWDRRAKVLQVSDARENVIEVRVLASGRDSATTWDLRCHVREELIKFVRERYPHCLPRIRAELDRTHWSSL